MDTKKKILIVEIVEDETPLRNVLRDKFKREGFEVLEAKNGAQGLELALAEHPDLILLDIMMPVMDGLAMLKKVHADDWGKQAKVMMLTNISDYEGALTAIENGSHDYLVKSDWKIDDIVKKVKEKLTE